MSSSAPKRFSAISGLLLGAVVCALPSISTSDDASLPERLSGHGGPVRSIAIANDGKYALTASFDYSIIHWSLEGERGAVIARLIGHEAAVNDAMFVAGNHQPPLAVSAGDDGAFAIWDLEKNVLVERMVPTQDKALDVDVSPDGRFAAVARWDNTARVYDLEKRTEILKLEGHTNNVNAVAFSADGSFLLTGSYDGDIRYWQIDPERALPGLQHGSVLYAHGWGINAIVGLGEDGQFAYGGQDGGVGVISLPSRQVAVVGSFGHPVLALAVSSDGKRLAAGSADGYLRVFDLETLEIVEDWQNPYGPVWGLAFANDGSRLYKAGLDDFVGHWQVDPRKPFDTPQGEIPRRFQVTEAADPGEAEFQRKCSVCHTLTPDDANRAGPTLYGLFGRKAGSVDGYPYSAALLNSDIVWDEGTIGKLFDHGPDVVTPGTKMPIQRLKNVERRDALIAFLKRATAESAGDGANNENNNLKTGRTE